MSSGGHASVASDLEVHDGLLSTLTDVLDIRDVFDRVSRLVQGVLPHDALGVMEISEKGDRISNGARQVLPHDGLVVSVMLPDGRHAHRYAASGFDAARLPDTRLKRHGLE